MVNDNCEKDILDLKDKPSVIIDRHFGAIYDYIITTEGKRTKVKECEISLIGSVEL